MKRLISKLSVICILFLFTLAHGRVLAEENIPLYGGPPYSTYRHIITGAQESDFLVNKANSMGMEKYAPSVYNNGVYKSGRRLDPNKTFLSVEYQGENAISDSTLNGMPLAYNGQDEYVDIQRPKNEASQSTYLTLDLKIKNFGYYKGKPLVFRMKRVGNNPALRIYKNGIVSPYIYVNPPRLNDYNLASFAGVEFWVEDEEGNIIDDPDVYFMYSYAFNMYKHPDPAIIQKNRQFLYDDVNTNDFYVITNDASDRSNPVDSAGTLYYNLSYTGPSYDPKLTNNPIISQRFKDDNISDNFTFAFTQTNKKTIKYQEERYIVRNYPNPTSGWSWTTMKPDELQFFSGKAVSPAKLPYTPPRVINTESNEGAQVEVIQELVRQARYDYYPDNFNMDVTVGDQASMDANRFKIYAGAKDITNKSGVSLSSSGNKLTINLTQTVLQELGGTSLTVKTEPKPLGIKVKPRLEIPISSKNNMNSNESKGVAVVLPGAVPETQPITALPGNINAILGDSIKDIDLSATVTNVKIGNVQLKPEEYEVKFTDDNYVLPSNYIQDTAMASVTVSEKKNPSNKTVVSNVPVNIGWGNSLFFMGWNGTTHTATSGAFTLHGGAKPVITSVPGGIRPTDPSKQKVHSNVTGKYYEFSRYDLSKIATTGTYNMTDNMNKPTTTLTADGQDIVQDIVEKWGDKGTQVVNYGDIVKTWAKENKLYQTKNGVRPANSNLFDKSNKTRYFEVTKSGYTPLTFNILKTTSGEITTGTTKNELDKQITNYIDLTGSDKLTAKFKTYPNTSNATNKTEGVITVVEQLGSGKSVSYDYTIDFKVISSEAKVTVNYYQWLNNTASTKKVVDNLKNGTRKKETVQSVTVEEETISELVKKNKNLQPSDIKGYTFNSNETDRISITLTENPNKKLQLTDRVPSEDFTINYYYEPTVQISVPTEINFGKREQKNSVNIYGMLPNKIEADNNISIINTYETSSDESSWNLYASTEGFYNEGSGIRLLANILFKSSAQSEQIEITNESTPIFVENHEFEKDILLADKKKEVGLFVKVGKVQELGEYNGVLKYKLQAAP